MKENNTVTDIETLPEGKNLPSVEEMLAQAVKETYVEPPKVSLLGVGEVEVTSGKRHAWVQSTVGRIRKPIWAPAISSHNAPSGTMKQALKLREEHYRNNPRKKAA